MPSSESLKGNPRLIIFMSKRKLIVAYVLLVGVPLLGLLGIVRAGQHLTPPISVGGTWRRILELWNRDLAAICW
jgi:hypothetical protein